MNSDRQLASQPPVKILSLDGGGVRGLSSLLIFEYIVDHIRKSGGLAETQKPCEMFDLIGGTGTGGIIAIMLGRLGMTVDQSIKAYKELANTVFSLEPTNLSTPSPDARLEKLESAIKKIIRENCSDHQCIARQAGDSLETHICLHEDMLFKDEHCTKTVNIETSPTIIATYDTSRKLAQCKIWEIAMAISTANADISIGIGRDQEEFVDAKYGYNNPCEVLIKEAKEEFPAREMMILSIGTGLGDVVGIRDSKSSIFTAYSKIAGTSKPVDLRLRNLYDNTGLYYRFNVENGLKDDTLPGTDKIGDIAAHTRNYLTENEVYIKKFAKAVNSVTSLSQPNIQQAVHDEKDKQCLSDLFVTSPTADKKDIEKRKGGLLKDCYKWIVHHEEFQRFKSDGQCRVLWIKGDPGKGKTMLLCGIIDELMLDPSVTLSYFFCQATGGSELNTATSVLRGLIHHLALHNPQLTKHVRAKYDYAGKKMFNNAGTWNELCEIVAAILDDPSLSNAIFIVDALDECSVERQSLLEFISTASPAKWIVSSRNWPDIEEILNDAEQKVKIHLEINQDSVSAAVNSYITFKTDELATKKRLNEKTKTSVLEHLRSNANGTFLWVALVYQELSSPRTRKWQTLEKLKSFPPGLDCLYGKMLEQINKSGSPQLCKDILGAVLVAYRSLTLEELHALVEELGDMDMKEVEEAISLCGSLLAIHGTAVSFILPSGIRHQHHMIFVRSLELLRVTLKRDIYDLQVPGRLIREVSTPEPNPLAPIRYCCIFWVDHLRDSSSDFTVTEQDRIMKFFKEKYLQWLEALSLLHSISVAGSALQKLEVYLGKESQPLQNIVKDARRFILSHVGIIEMAPLQIYASALIFSPTKSWTRRNFSREEPDWIEVKPKVEADWNACLQTLEGHHDRVTSVVFSNDGQRLASGSDDKTVKIWDATSGTCLHTLKGHCGTVTSLVFSKDGQRLASGSWDETVKIWDATFDTYLHTLEGHSDCMTSVVFSADGQRLASGSRDKTVKIWDATFGTYLHTLEGHSDCMTSVVFSADGQRLASGSRDKTVKIWNATSGTCLHTLVGHDGGVTSVVFSDDRQRLASGSGDETVKIWDATSGMCLHTLEGHDHKVTSVVFSADGHRLASASMGISVKIWNVISGVLLYTLSPGHIPFSLDPFHYPIYSLDAGLLDLDMFMSSAVLSTDQPSPDNPNLPRSYTPQLLNHSPLLGFFLENLHHLHFIV
ncbi:Vegetative incompatibility protein HET-E-1 [Ceratocystis lukuohia]|uniref:Mitochondrial division protein 1 n=1 Tax=Ceratocystis lukuohia TaxID=2019550 RepID=A0ABR4MBZ8_9PEZI